MLSDRCLSVLSVTPPKKAAQPPPQIFGPCLLWQNGRMDQNGTSYGGRPRPSPHCVRWGPSSNFWPMSIVAKRWPISVTAEHLLLPALLHAAQTCRYLVYSEADFEVFRPAGAKRCTDGGEIWHRGGGDRRSPPPCQISPPSVQRQGCRTPKIEIFTQI